MGTEVSSGDGGRRSNIQRWRTSIPSVIGEAIAEAMPESQAVSVSSDPAERLAVLFDTHQARLYRLARRLAGRCDEARDLVQETFLRAARSPGSVPAGASREEAWLVRVLINICRDGWRKRAVRTRLDPQLDSNGTSRATQEDALIARSDVWRAISGRSSVSSSRRSAPIPCRDSRSVRCTIRSG